MSKNKKDEIMDHNYDGIQEYDNPMPMWWTSTFIISTIFAFAYVFGITFGQIDDYQDDMKEDNAANEILRQAEAAKNPPISAELLTEKLKDPETVKQGAGVFAMNCASCHGPEGQGVIGPNLTDNAFLYGKKPMESHEVITKGTPKGMPPWGEVLSQNDMISVIAFVVSIRGSKPSNPKAAEGKVIE